MSLVMRQSGDVTWRGYLVGYYESNASTMRNTVWTFRGYTDEAPDVVSGSPPEVRASLTKHFLMHERAIGKKLLPHSAA
jgi:hypothetical protein